ncbi:3-oxoacyl-[acyl-carrier-protein] reductase [Clostridium oryzae]|uniref:3-oxoacyl-[acyl-carrier-protein] reductase n=1 Tax=Clostridium oryzae TaxID=1450648 RepID=A0A1V4IUL6_9CLOT|nr:3-oxoacyl-[acyl-carrier-protein] reductase [Clostridium oryzae]OPJ63609.1 3-oxoacyl-[acyl-carrier-protein] reductase FabG [Clostridium oryzae]
MSDRECAIVTGAGRGIGKAIALRLAKSGINIVVNYRKSEDEANEIVKLLEAEGVEAIAVKADVSKFDDAEALIKAAVDKFGKIDILVNNAGITKDALIMRMKEADFDSVINVNLKGCFNCTKHVSSVMLKQRKGRIVNISSIIGVIGNAGQANYSASKAGIIGITKSTAKELGSRGITVNAVAPGYIETEMTDVLPEKQKKAMLDSIPLRRAGKPEDIAELVNFLCSESASYITGQVINIDGGMV